MKDSSEKHDASGVVEGRVEDLRGGKYLQRKQRNTTGKPLQSPRGHPGAGAGETCCSASKACCTVLGSVRKCFVVSLRQHLTKDIVPYIQEGIHGFALVVSIGPSFLCLL